MGECKKFDTRKCNRKFRCDIYSQTKPCIITTPIEKVSRSIYTAFFPLEYKKVTYEQLP